MDEVFEAQSARGSVWHRWDPHIHTPGTALNDQYIGQAAWSTFLDAIELADPPIRALGVTAGGAYRPELTADDAALSEGANQFKVNLDQLRDAWKKNEWVRSHALIAVRHSGRWRTCFQGAGASLARWPVMLAIGACRGGVGRLVFDAG